MEWRAQWKRRRSVRARVSQRLDRRYTAREVAEGLDVELKAVRRWIRNGWLRARRPNHLNNRYRIRLAAIKRAMQHPAVLSDVGRRLQWRAKRVSVSGSVSSRSHAPPASPPVTAIHKPPPTRDTPIAGNTATADDNTSQVVALNESATTDSE